MIRKETRASLGNSKAGNNLSHISFCHIRLCHILLPSQYVLGINTTVVHILRLVTLVHLL